MADEKDKKATDATDAKPAAGKPATEKKPAAKAKAAAKPAAEKKPAAKKAADKKPATKKAADKPAKTEAKGDGEKTEAKPKTEKPKDAGAKKPSSKSSTRRKPTKETVGEPVLVRATAKYVRSSARKSRLVVDHIRGKSVEDARVTLQFIPRHVARDVAKVLESAVANAEHNHELDADDLNVVIAYVDEGPTFKRWRPRARGRATQILKRTSHITVVVSNATAQQISNKSKKKTGKAVA